MQYRKAGNTNLNVSVICLGTMTFGEQNSQSEAFEQMDYAYERGINFFDTAEIYPIYPKKETCGKTEEIIGSWFQQKKNRSKVVLTSKIASKTENDVTWIRDGAEKLGFDKKNMNAAIDASLQRLQTDYIDLYQLHWPDRPMNIFGSYKHIDGSTNSIESILDALGELVKQGKIRYIGLSNETPWGTMEFLFHSKKNNLPRIQSIQNAYNFLNRAFESGGSEISFRENVGLLAYSPLAQGYLTGKYQNGALPEGSRKQLFDKKTGM